MRERNKSACVCVMETESSVCMRERNKSVCVCDGDGKKCVYERERGIKVHVCVRQRQKVQQQINSKLPVIERDAQGLS